MSGLTVLENLRDRGVSRSPARDTTRGNEKYARAGGDSFNLLSRDLQVKLVIIHIQCASSHDDVHEYA